MATTVADESVLEKAPAKSRAAKRAPKKATAAAAKVPAKKAAAKKAPAKKAAATKVTATEGTVTREKLGPSGWLQDAILEICTQFADKKLDTGGNPLTPHRIAKLVAESGKGKKDPSAGAVAACLDRWDAYGFAVISETPKAFVRFTPAGKKKGLEAMVEAHRAARWEANKAARAAAK